MQEDLRYSLQTGHTICILEGFYSSSYSKTLCRRISDKRLWRKSYKYIKNTRFEKRKVSITEDI